MKIKECLKMLIMKKTYACVLAVMMGAISFKTNAVESSNAYCTVVLDEDWMKKEYNTRELERYDDSLPPDKNKEPIGKKTVDLILEDTRTYFLNCMAIFLQHLFAESRNVDKNNQSNPNYCRIQEIFSGNPCSKINDPIKGIHPELFKNIQNFIKPFLLENKCIPESIDKDPFIKDLRPEHKAYMLDFIDFARNKDKEFLHVTHMFSIKRWIHRIKKNPKNQDIREIINDVFGKHVQCIYSNEMYSCLRYLCYSHIIYLDNLKNILEYAENDMSKNFTTSNQQAVIWIDGDKKLHPFNFDSIFDTIFLTLDRKNDPELFVKQPYGKEEFLDHKVTFIGNGKSNVYVNKETSELNKENLLEKWKNTEEDDDSTIFYTIERTKIKPAMAHIKNLIDHAEQLDRHIGIIQKKIWEKNDKNIKENSSDLNQDLIRELNKEKCVAENSIKKERSKIKKAKTDHEIKQYNQKIEEFEKNLKKIKEKIVFFEFQRSSKNNSPNNSPDQLDNNPLFLIHKASLPQSQ